MTDFDQAHVPRGAVVNGQILTTSYFDGVGQMKYVVNVRGEMNLAQALGLLVLAGITVYQDYMGDEPFPPDE